MKICYLWVDRFRNFDNQGFNFSSNVKFKFDRRNFRLTKKSLKPLPSSFFNVVNIEQNDSYSRRISSGKIVEVTGLIGKNGAGKSNVLEALLKSLKGAKSTMPCDFLIITMENDQYKCSKYMTKY